MSQFLSSWRSWGRNLVALGLGVILATFAVPAAAQQAALLFGSSGGAAVPLSVTSAGNVNIAFGGDVILVRDAANILAMRNGTTAQALRIYNTFTDASNYERLGIGWATNVMDIQTENAGTGEARNLGFGTGSTRYWLINATGHWVAQSDNTNDIGANAASRPRDVFIARLFAPNNRVTTTVDAATTFAVTSSYTELACTGPETINTITSGVTGAVIWLENSDTECTIADDDNPTAANAVDLTGAATNDVGAVAKVIGLIHNGTSWLQIFESDN